MGCGYKRSMALKRILITGGAGFIGSAVVRHIIENTDDSAVVLDCLTYAGNLESLATVANNPRYAFEQVNICDRAALDAVFEKYQPDAVMHLAAESHVDRSIDGPAAFIETNIVGTYTLLEAARHYWSALNDEKKAAFRFHHISTDEVYGDLEGLMVSSQKPRLMRQVALIPHRKHRAITWFVHGKEPMVCRR